MKKCSVSVLLSRLPDAQHVNKTSPQLCSLSLPLLQVDMNSARAKELAFFKANPRYADLKNVGMGHLAGHLSGHLITAIRKQLPQISHSINTGGLLAHMGCQSTTHAVRAPALGSLCLDVEDLPLDSNRYSIDTQM